MTTSRRDFLSLSLAAGAAAAIGAAPVRALARPRRDRPLNILVLGGTGFIGPAIVEASKARGHTLTLFNRGKTEKRKGGMFPELDKLYGNRDPDKHAEETDESTPKGLDSIAAAIAAGRKWDAVIDTSGYYPRHVGASANLLAPAAGRYIFISSISAYGDTATPGQDETGPVGTIPDPTVETMGADYSNYGPLKALCEQAAEKAFGTGRAVIVRPGFIVGPGDPTDRFTYWPVRVQRGGEVLAPGTPNDPVQLIDVRDLAEWLLTLAEGNASGYFNAVTPPDMLTMGSVLQACKTAAKNNPTFTWVDSAFIESQNLSPGGDLPIWLPPTGQTAGFHAWKTDRATAAGLKCRPILETCTATLEWWPKEVDRRTKATAKMIEDAEKEGKPAPKLPDPSTLRAGLPPAREAEVLEAFHKKNG